MEFSLRQGRGEECSERGHERKEKILREAERGVQWDAENRRETVWETKGSSKWGFDGSAINSVSLNTVPSFCVKCFTTACHSSSAPLISAITCTHVNKYQFIYNIYENGIMKPIVHH